jgi:hypothetical protein
MACDLHATTQISLTDLRRETDPRVAHKNKGEPNLSDDTSLDRDF